MEEPRSHQARSCPLTFSVKWVAMVPDSAGFSMDDAIFAEFEREILRDRTGAGLAHARQTGKRLGRPATAAVHAAEIRELHRAGISKSEIARRVQVGRTSVRRILGVKL